MPTSTGSQVTYSQPITVIASENAPADETQAEEWAEKSETFIEESQVAFKAATTEGARAVQQGDRRVAG